MATVSAWRSLRARSAESLSLPPPTTASFQLKPRYRMVVVTAVRSDIPRFSISGVSAVSPSMEMRTAWSKLSEPIPDTS